MLCVLAFPAHSCMTLVHLSLLILPTHTGYLYRTCLSTLKTFTLIMKLPVYCASFHYTCPCMHVSLRVYCTCILLGCCVVLLCHLRIRLLRAALVLFALCSFF